MATLKPLATLAENNRLYRYLSGQQRRYRALGERAKRLDLLYRLSSAVGQTLVEDDVFRVVLTFAQDLTRASRCCLFIQSQAGGLVVRAYGDRDADRDVNGRIVPAELAAWGGTLDAETAFARLDTNGDGELDATELAGLFRDEQGQARAIPGCSSALCRDAFSSGQPGFEAGAMAVPLRGRGHVIGVLYVDGPAGRGAFAPADLELLETVGAHTSFALENARLYRIATIDDLTQLYYRAHFEQRVREELARCRRYGGEFAVLSLDIDFFKQFNDRYGHAVGDRVLRHTADVIKAAVRTDIDVCARVGGEELAVLLPETNLERARLCGERIREALAATHLHEPDHGDLAITVSIGAAAYPTHGAAVRELLEQADAALYVSKNAGRNRLTVAGAASA